jgi:isoquinoline 1-oxidoreductase beta subunit
MIAAEELDVSFDQMRVIPSNTNNPTDNLGTGGSTSTMSLYQPIREVAAQMRQMLVTAVADHWSMKEEDIKTSNGIASAGEKKMTYAQIAEVTTKWKNPGKPKTKSSDNFKIIGTNVTRTDILAKIKGEAIFGIDMEIPEMVYGVLVKSPYLEAIPTNVKTEKALSIKGVTQVLIEEDFIVVIASNRYAAEMGARAVEVEWSIPKKWNQKELDEWVKVGNGNRSEIMNDGNPKSKFRKDSDSYFSASFRTAAGSHAQMEPNGAIAHFKNGSVKIIAGLQALPSFQKQVAKLLKIDKKDVFIQNAFLGGGFGRRSFYQDVAKIALVSKLIGLPIHIFGTRTQEFQNGYLRPSTHHTFEVQLAANGIIEAINYQLATDNMLLSHYPEIAEFFLGSDPASAHGSRITYDIQHKKVTYWKTKLPFTVGSWRGIGMFANTFAIESLMDQLAEKTKTDPIEFRLKHLSDKDETHIRQKNVLNRLLTDKIWTTEKTSGIGRGMACADDRKTIVATVAEVAIEHNQIVVKKITSVIDAGRIVNPEGVRQQVEGCAIMGIGATLFEKIDVQDGAITTTNFHQYSLPLLSDIPKIEVILVESHLDPLGVGEPPIAPISAAIANAVYNLTGKRLHKLPLNLNEDDLQKEYSEFYE